MGGFQSSAFLAFTTLVRLASATSNSTGFEPRFVPEPRGRGTVGILWSCLVTLGLCIWTAVHTDVVPTTRKRERLMHKFVWMFYCLLMPEIVVASALKQWLKAREVHQKWCKHFKVEPGSKRDLMGMEGAFFVVMGGFVICEEERGKSSERGGGRDEEERDEEERREEVSCSTIEPEEFIKYLESHKIPRNFVNRRIITDKGKADTLAKLLVCLQASWMVIQCAARKARGLPVTLLELHVLIQVAFVVAMYGFWWNKPLGVNEPIVAVERKGMFITDTSLVAKYPKEFGLHEGLIAFASIWKEAYFCGGYDEQPPHIITLMCLLTSVSHAIAWNYHFPTPIEGLLWRVSSVVLGAVPFVQYLVLFLFWETEILGNIFGSPFFYLYLVYGFGIVFITVESFLSMRRLPENSYQTVAWMDFWPHI